MNLSRSFVFHYYKYVNRLSFLRHVSVFFLNILLLFKLRFNGPFNNISVMSGFLREKEIKKEIQEYTLRVYEQFQRKLLC